MRTVHSVSVNMCHSGGWMVILFNLADDQKPVQFSVQKRFATPHLGAMF